MSQKKTDYNKYLKSKDWNNKKIEVYNLYGYACQRCGVKRRLHVHHKTYIRFKNENIKKDLSILCEDCHNLYHTIYSHTGIKTTNIFIKDKSIPKLIKNKLKRLKAPVNKKLLFIPRKKFLIRKKVAELSKIKLHNPKDIIKIDLLEF